MRAVRSGFAAFLDYPYAIDNYDSLPSFLLRGNPASYHRYFKEAGFVTEKGQVDYTAPLTPEILARYRRMAEAAAVAGVTIQSWREYGFLAAIDAWTDVTNAAFDRHWGWNPVTRAEVRPMLTSLWETPVADLSMLATIDGECVGAVFSVPDLSPALARVRRGVRLDPERGGGTRGALINIGVVERARGRGVATRDGGAIVPRDGAAQDALCRLHPRARRQLGLAPHGAQPGRARHRQLRDVSPFVTRRLS